MSSVNAVLLCQSRELKKKHIKAMINFMKWISWILFYIALNSDLKPNPRKAPTWCGLDLISQTIYEPIIQILKKKNII